MAKSVNIESRISLIVKEMADGRSRSDIFRKYGQKWAVSIKTVDKYITRARKRVQEAQRLKQKAEADALYEHAKEAEKRRILSREERMELLTKIALGEIEVPDDDFKWDASQKKFVKIKRLMLPTHEARKAAINELNKMDGEHAPAKVANTDTKGMDIPPITLTLPKGMNINLPSNIDGEDKEND